MDPLAGLSVSPLFDGDLARKGRATQIGFAVQRSLQSSDVTDRVQMLRCRCADVAVVIALISPPKKLNN